MSNPKVIDEDFTCDELAEALMVRLKPFILESIQEGLEKMNEGARLERSKDNVTGFTPDEPQIPDTGRYSATEVSKILNIHRTTLFQHTKNNAIKRFFSTQKTTPLNAVSENQTVENSTPEPKLKGSGEQLTD